MIIPLISILYYTLSATASSGCGSNNIHFNSHGHATRTLPNGRTYLLHIPSNYNNNTEHAVVLGFHGAGEDSENQEHISQFSDAHLLINGKGIIAAYPQAKMGNSSMPQGHQTAWEGAPYANGNVDDVQLTKDVLADISSNLCVDPSRIYASGKSNGGGFVNLLACRPDTSPLFGAFAVVSGALYPGTHSFSGCAPGRPIPLITFHGLNDTVVPFQGEGSGDYETPDIDEWRRQWASRNGCAGTDPKPTSVSHPYDHTTNSTWSCTEPVQGFTVGHLGHSWPTTAGLDHGQGYLTNAAFNATSPAIIDFFDRFTVPSTQLRMQTWLS